MQPYLILEVKEEFANLHHPRFRFPNAKQPPQSTTWGENRRYRGSRHITVDINELFNNPSFQLLMEFTSWMTATASRLLQNAYFRRSKF
jgi:hypothetical protein